VATKRFFWNAKCVLGDLTTIYRIKVYVKIGQGRKRLVHILGEDISHFANFHFHLVYVTLHNFSTLSNAISTDMLVIAAPLEESKYRQAQIYYFSRSLLQHDQEATSSKGPSKSYAFISITDGGSSMVSNSRKFCKF
jgi:hypothetical protein